MEAATCPGCAAQLSGRYCMQCGQRAPAADDFSARRFVRSAWDELTGSDSRLLRTLRALWIPGELTRAFAAREWRRYLPPLRLYLLLSGVFFLLAWGAYTRANSAAALDPNIPAAVRAVLTDPDAQNDISAWTAWLKFASVLVLAVWVAVLQWRTRLPFGMHLAFAAHYYCVDFLLFSLGAPVLWLVPPAALPAAFSAVFAAGVSALLVWCVLALRRAYARRWAAAIVGGACVLVADLVLSIVSGQLAIAIVLLQRT